MTRVIGLDLSLTGTGIALYDTDHIDPHPETKTLTSRPATDDLDARSVRLRTLAQNIVTHAAGYGTPDLVMVESRDFTVARKAATYGHDLSGLWWLVVSRLTANGIPCCNVNPTAMKTYALGKGSGSGTDKEHVLAAVIRRYPHVEVQNNNEADALILALMGARYLGAPYEAGTLPDTHSRAMTKIVWPNMKGAR